MKYDFFAQRLKGGAGFEDEPNIAAPMGKEPLTITEIEDDDDDSLLY
jgi:transitional endoplasmic reticulum ATPase